MRQEPGNGRRGGNRFFPATSGCMTDRVEFPRSRGREEGLDILSAGNGNQELAAVGG